RAAPRPRWRRRWGRPLRRQRRERRCDRLRSRWGGPPPRRSSSRIRAAPAWHPPATRARSRQGAGRQGSRPRVTLRIIPPPSSDHPSAVSGDRCDMLLNSSMTPTSMRHPHLRAMPWLLAITGLLIPLVSGGFAGWWIALTWSVLLGLAWALGGALVSTPVARIAVAIVLL